MIKSISNSLDLSTVVPTVRVVDIKHPGTGEKIGVRVSLLPYEHEVMKQIKRRILDRRIQMEQRGKAYTSIEIEKNKHDLAFTAMTGWDWYTQDAVTDKDGKVIKQAIDAPNFHGSQPSFGQANVIAVFTELPWFYDQISEEISDGAAFFAMPAPN